MEVTAAGNVELSNLVIACAPCTYGRYDRTLAEVGAGASFSRLREKVVPPYGGIG